MAYGHKSFGGIDDDSKMVLSVVWACGGSNDHGFGEAVSEGIELGVQRVSGICEVLGVCGGAGMRQCGKYSVNSRCIPKCGAYGGKCDEQASDKWCPLKVGEKKE